MGNRISTIIQLVPSESWHHVRTEQNPADCASRGISPQELLDHSMWWNGPHWLASDPIQMPDQPAVSDLASLITLELKTVVCNAVTPVPPEWIEERYSSYHKSQHGSSVPLTTSLQNCSTIPNESTSISTHPRLPKPSIFCFIEFNYDHTLMNLLNYHQSTYHNHQQFTFIITHNG